MVLVCDEITRDRLSYIFVFPRDNCDKFGCQWCTRNSTGALLSTEKQRCDYSETCPNGQLLPIPKTTPKPPNTHKPPKGTSAAAIVVPIIVVLVLIAAAILGYIIWKRRKESEIHKEKSQNVHNDVIRNQNVVVDFPLSEHGRNGVMF